MRAEMEVYCAAAEDVPSLFSWLSGLPDVAAEVVPRAPRAGEQGGAWDFLSVACGTGGAATVVVQALRSWIESRVTVIQVKVGDDEVEMRSSNAAEMTPPLIDMLKAMGQDDDRTD